MENGNLKTTDGSALGCQKKTQSWQLKACLLPIFFVLYLFCDWTETEAEVTILDSCPLFPGLNFHFKNEQSGSG